ncbi:hypothetical protein [Deinococcus sp. ME38]|uniref:hypothetical protein n=1 Tax=Deinococcus sp. ME38 TaxID=3400344 RepID=UPI003B5A39CF
MTTEQATTEASAGETPETPSFQLSEELKTYVKELRKDISGTRDEVDKILITLSTATMGFLLTMRQQIVVNRPTDLPPLGFDSLFWGAAGMLFLCIMVVLVSHHVSMAVTQRIVDRVEGLTSWDDESYQEVIKTQKLVQRVHELNLASSLSFVAGLVLSVAYITLNAN